MEGEWNDSEAAIIRRFRGRCIICLKRFATLHHIVPRSAGRKSKEAGINNLIPLCARCHDQVHRTGTYKWRKRLEALRERRLKEFPPLK